MLGIVGGTSLHFSTLPDLEKQRVETPYGSADLLVGDIVMLMRHQDGIPPHRINHCANLSAMAIAGVDRIVAFGSSGSLRPEIRPGSLVIPTDYVSMTDIPSIHAHAIEHVMPEISPKLAKQLSSLVPAAKFGGVYIQTRGPRIETVAEVRMLTKCADIVGMTVASEATLACELKMDFCTLCTVDNYANGLGKEVLTFEHILETSKTHRHRTEEIVNIIVEKMG